MAKANSNVLVTGGAGFIGSHLVQALLKKGYQVTVFDNFTTGKLDNLNNAIKNPNFRITKGDVRNPIELQRAFKNTHAIVHLAAQIDVATSVKDPVATHDINTTGTVNVLQTAIEKHVERLVFASSTAIYGDNPHLPLTEDLPPLPLSPYAASKAAAEAYIKAYTDCYKLNAIILRFFNVYGRGNEKNPYSGVIAKFITRAQKNEPLIIEGDGEQTRDFIHVSDVVRALLLALEQTNLKGETFNICTGTPVSINQLAEATKAATANKLSVTHVPPRNGDIRKNYGNPSKATAKLGFTSTINLEQGLKMLL